jgi:transposase
MQTRTARINAVRGLLREFGITIPVGARQLVPRVRVAIEDGAVPTDLVPALEDALTEIEELKRKSQGIERRLKGLAQHMPEAALLMSVPGIGVLTATALVAYVGDVRRFRSGRHFAAYLGLTPRASPDASAGSRNVAMSLPTSMTQVGGGNNHEHDPG